MDNQSNNQRKRNGDNQILSGNIVGTILRLAWPVSLGLLMQAGFNIADMKFVSMLGKDEMAAVGIVLTLFFLVYTVVQTFGIGTVSLISRAFGAGRMKYAEEVLKMSLVVLFSIGALLVAAGFFFPRQVVYLLGARGAVLQDLSAQYLRIVSLGLLPNLIAWGAGYTFQGGGDFKTPMYSALLGTVINLVLDPILILGWGPIPSLGIAGAAWATSIAQMSACVFVIARLLFYSKAPVKLNLAAGKGLDFAIGRKMFKIGWPVGVHSFILFLSLLILMNMVAELGNSEVAAISVVVRLLMLIGIPALALGEVVTAMVGQTLGANAYKRSISITNTAFVIGIITTAVLGVLAALFSKESIQFFASFENQKDSQEVFRYGVIALSYIVGIVFFWMSVLIFGGAFKGSGNTQPPMVVGFIRLVMILVVPFFGILEDPFRNILLSMTIAFGLEGILVYVWYRRGGWYKAHLKEARTHSVVYPHTETL